jgi:glycosyltransferase involved in cell wall biosynthesis
MRSNVPVVNWNAESPRPPARPPTVSFGLPVYNAGDRLGRLLDSLVAQDLRDLEVVICDNGSTDGTVELCRAYAARDPRVRLIENGRNLGQIANFNKVLDEARGELFRWIGADDWLEPGYARRCAEVLRANPALTGVTTYQDHLGPRGERHYVEFDGERLESPDPRRRFVRMLWFFSQDYGLIDPIYTMMRRERLLATERLQLVPNTDMVLAAELSLTGPFAHIPECLAHRGAPPWGEYTELLKRYHPNDPRVIAPSRIATRMVPALARMLARAPLTPRQRVECILPIAAYAGRTTWFFARLGARSTAARAWRAARSGWRAAPAPAILGGRR